MTTDRHPDPPASPPSDGSAEHARYQSIFRPGLFAGRTVLVTGGGSGIGRCIAHELASLGANLVLVGRKLEKLAAVVAEIEADGGRADAVAFDIREEAAVTAGIAAIVSKHGPIHGLVNNAGGQFPAPLETISQKGFETVVRTNLVGGFLVARECFKQSMRTTGGAIVNIVADMWNGMPGMAHSGAARAGMVNLTQTAAVEWAGAGVRVNAVAPGWIASSGLDTYQGAAAALIPQLAKAVPSKRLGNEAEVSAAVVFLLSDAAAFITASTLRVDGGAPMMPHIWPMPARARSTEFPGFHRAIVPAALRASAPASPPTPAASDKSDAKPAPGEPAPGESGDA